MKKRWLNAVASFLVLAGILLSGGLGVVYAYFADVETSSGNTFTAWVSMLWRQTTVADFNAGVSENVSIVSANPPPADNGDVILTTGIFSHVVTNSPSASSGGWTNPTGAYADSEGYAYITSGTPSASQTYGGYGFNLPPNSTVTNVRVRHDAWYVPTAPTFKAAGAFTFGAGAITPPYPTGAGAPAAGDIAILVCESENEPISLSSPQGFVELGHQANKAAGTPATNPASRLAVYWKRCVGGDTAPTVADSGDHTTARIYLFSGVKTSGNPWNTYSEGNDGGANDTSGVIPGGTTTVDNCLIFLICTSSFDGTSTAQFSGWTNAGLGSITEIGDNTNAINLGGGHGAAIAVKATAGSFGGTTVTLANTSFKGAMMIALEPANDQIWVDVSWDSGSTWSSKWVQTLTDTEATYWYDVTGATTWDATKLNDSNLRVRVVAYMAGNAAQVRLDWLPIEVTYATSGYVSPGKIASQVLDTGAAGASWGLLSWDETLPAGTDITFEVRSSDTPFAKDAATPTWVSVGGTSPVSSGLPSGRYKQWRATLTTSNDSSTPRLHEVRLWYDP